jgi:hypothetical protein
MHALAGAAGFEFVPAKVDFGECIQQPSQKQWRMKMLQAVIDWVLPGVLATLPVHPPVAPPLNL